MNVGGVLTVALGVLMAAAGLILIGLQLRMRSVGAVPTAPPGPATVLVGLNSDPLPPTPIHGALAPASGWVAPIGAARRGRGDNRFDPSPPSAVDQPPSAAEDRSPAAPPTQQPYVPQGELVEEDQRLSDDVPRLGGRAPRESAAWRYAVDGMRATRSGGGLRTVVVVTIVVGVVVVVVGLIVRAPVETHPAAPGSATLAIADFGEGPDFARTDLGSITARTVLQEVQSGLGSAAARARMPVISVGLVRTPAEAEQELARSRAQALLWGTLPAGAAGTISATLAWQGSPPAAPWLRVGPTGRLLLPASMPLSGQPLVATKSLAPVLQAVQFYEAGDYAQAAARAAGLAADAPSATQNLAAFIRANVAVTNGSPETALPIYQALEARGWIDPAVYNNWGVAATMAGDTARAAERLQHGADLVPAPPPAQLALILTNKGIATQAAGDLAGAQAAYDGALAADPGAVEAIWRRGYLAYRQGNSAAAEDYTARALRADPTHPEVQRLEGLIRLMDREPLAAVDHFTQARQTYDTWIASLHAQEAALVSRDAIAVASPLSAQIQALAEERSRTIYYIGLAYADQARSKPPEGFAQKIWRSITGSKSDADRAIAAFQDAMPVNGDRSDVRYQMGVIYHQQGDRAQARDSFARAKALNPADPAAFEALAGMDLEDGHQDAAIGEYQALVAANPGYMPAYIQLAHLYDAAGANAGRDHTYGLLAAKVARTPREHLIRAQALAALGRNAEAVDEARTAAAADPSLWEAPLLLAGLYSAAGQDEPALAQYELVRAQQPYNVLALYESGRILAARGRTDEAAKLWRQVETLQPDHPEVHFALGGLYEQKASLARQQHQDVQAASWTDQALQEYNLAVEKNAGRADGLYHLALLYEQKGDLRAAEQRYGDAVKADANLVEAWQGSVRVLLKQPGRDADALKAAQAFHQHAPNDVRGMLLLGDVFLFRNDPTAALGQYQQAIKRTPGDPTILYGLGRAYHQQGDVERADQYFRAALQAQPGNSLALTGLGDLSLERSLDGQAQDAYNQALRADPNYAPAYIGRGRLLDHMSVSNPNLGQQAVEALQHAAALDPSSAEAHFYLGEVYIERNIWPDAIREYTLAATLRPSWAMPPFRLGQAYLEQEKLPEAIKAYQQTVQLDPGMLEGWFGLGQAQRGAGDRKAAIAAYQQAIQLKGDYAAAWLYLGYTLREDGNRKDAAGAFRHAIDSAAGDAAVRDQAQEALSQLQ